MASDHPPGDPATEIRTCVVVATRMRFRTPLSLPVAYAQHRQVSRLPHRNGGLLHSVILFEGMRTVMTFSVWTSKLAIETFQAACAHSASQVRHSLEVA